MTFVLAAYPDGVLNGGDVNLSVHTTEDATQEPASNALLYGLAILMLDQTGVIDQTMAHIVQDGVPSEADAVARINLLLKEEHSHEAQ